MFNAHNQKVIENISFVGVVANIMFLVLLLSSKNSHIEQGILIIMINLLFWIYLYFKNDE